MLWRFNKILCGSIFSKKSPGPKTETPKARTPKTRNLKTRIPKTKNLKQGFKITISWNKHRSEKTTEAKNNDLVYLIDLTFRNIYNNNNSNNNNNNNLFCFHVQSTMVLLPNYTIKKRKCILLKYKSMSKNI